MISITPHLTTHSTGARIECFSSSFAATKVECSSPRPVNSSVMSPLRIDTKLNTASPLLCNGDVDEIIERLVENGGSWINPWWKYMPFLVSYHLVDWKDQMFVVAEWMRYNITNQSTGRAISLHFIFDIGGAPVISSVMSPLRIATTLIAASPLLMSR